VVFIVLGVFTSTGCPAGVQVSVREADDIELIRPNAPDLEAGEEFNPVDITPWSLSITPRTIHVDGNSLYAGCQFGGLYRFDLAGPDNPRFVEVIETPSSTGGLASKDGNVFICCRWEGLKVIKTHDDSPGEIVATYATSGDAVDVAVDGNRAYLTSSSGWESEDGLFEVLDITDPENPESLGSVTTGGAAMHVIVKGSYAYLTEGRNGGVTVIDIAIPSNPRIVRTVEFNYPRDMAIGNDMLYVTDAQNVYSVDISDPEGASIVGQAPQSVFSEVMSTNGTCCYTAGTNAGLDVIEMEPADSIRVCNTYNEMPGGTYDMAISGDRAYLVGTYGILTLDISDSRYPEKINESGAVSNCMAVELYGHKAISLFEKGISVIDFSDPENASVVGRATFDGYIHTMPMDKVGIGVYNGYAYVPGYDKGLVVFDIDPPEETHHVTDIFTGGAAKYVAAAMGTALMGVEEFNPSPAGGDQVYRLKVFDISDPANTRETDSINLEARVSGMWISGDRAIIACTDDFNDTSYKILTIESPGRVKNDGAFETDYRIVDSDKNGTYLYVLDEPEMLGCMPRGWEEDYTFAFKIVELDGTNANEVIGSIEMMHPPGPVSVIGGYAYMFQTGELTIIDVDPPESPEIVMTTEMEIWAQGIDVLSGYAFIGRGHAGMRMIQLW